MACKVCHRQGLCTECCCISTDHTHPRKTECGLCKHLTRYGREKGTQL